LFEEMSGFKLAPSRLNRPPASEDAVASPAKTNFVGLTASKLGLLAEPKLTPSSGAIQAKSSNGDAADGAESSPQSSSQLATPSTFSFTPLTKPVDEASKKEDRVKDEEKAVDGGEQRVAKMPVFGENLSEKVTAVPSTEPNNTDGQILKEPPEEKTEDVANAGSGKFVASSLLFSNAAKASDDENEKKTLSESAAEYTESHTNKRKYDVVDVVTGEEAESNVLQGQVKLYIFDKDKRNWTERGRGLLRLNDSPVSKPGHLKSRLVVRTSGNMRVVLNTKLWSDMICEKANEKNIRISALDEGEVKIFLIACSIKEAEKLYTALEYRINQLKTDKENGEGEEEDESEEKADGGGDVSPEKRMKPSEASSTEA